VSTTSWPHGHLAHALKTYLLSLTAASTRVYVDLPATRTYPLLVVQEAGLGSLGTDSAIQADERRVQIDAWAERHDQAAALSEQVFGLLDARFAAALARTTLTTQDGVTAGNDYQTKIEWIHRSGGGTHWFDEFARCWRVTTFYNVKVNL
jgi:hypothetical protein